MIFFFITTIILVILIISTGLYLIYGINVNVDNWYFGLTLVTLLGCLVYIVSVYSVYILN